MVTGAYRSSFAVRKNAAAHLEKQAEDPSADVVSKVDKSHEREGDKEGIPTVSTDSLHVSCWKIQLPTYLSTS